MNRVFPLWSILVLAVEVAQAAPPDALAIATADARTLPKEVAYRQRYLDLSHLPPEQRAVYAKALSFHVNSLSRESDIVPLRIVGGGAVLALDLADYAQWDKSYQEQRSFRAVWERLGTLVADNYYRVEILTTFSDGKKVRQIAPAPWLPLPMTLELERLTWSKAAVIRGDWFLWYTSIQKDRVVGYYDFLGLGNKEADFQRLGGVHEAEADQLHKVVAASVARSGVAIHNRGIERTPSLTGGYWKTRDYKTSEDRQNVLRVLRGDTKPPKGDASEQYLVLPNGLFAYGLFDANGNRQDVVPQDIALDHKSPSNDRNIYGGIVSCTRCHVEGLRPIDDFVRGLFRNPLELRSPDYDKLKQLRQQYFSDLPGQLAADNAVFAARVRQCNGLSVRENAGVYSEAWSHYLDEPVTPDRAAAELGVSEAEFTAKVTAYARTNPLFDPVVAGYAASPPVPARREHWQEVYSQLWGITHGNP